MQKYIMGNKIPYDNNLNALPKNEIIKLIGGKALGLWRFTDLNTPKWFVITTAFFDAIYNDDKTKINELVENENYYELEQLIMLKKFPDSMVKMILNRLSESKQYAVRSSAVDEDSTEHSFAGIMSSYLNVNYNTIITYIQRCYLSVFLKPALEYRQNNKLDKFNIKMAVIVEEMIDADYAGVINTINPVTNNPDELLISVVKGLGESLVSGKENSFDYYVNGNNIKGDFNFINKKLILKIAKLSYQVTSRSKTFQDIEFAVKNNKVYFLQTRTIVPYKDIDITKPKTVYDNANIIESYSGTTTPLTFSFAKEVYKLVYTKTLQEGKVNKKIIKALDPYLKDMLRLYDSKIYYNLNSWYKLTSIFPGSKNNLGYMENMMGVKTKMTKVKKIKMSLWDSLKLGVILLNRLHKMPKLTEKFLLKFETIVMKYYQNSFKNYQNKELIDIYNYIEENILADFTTPIVNDVGAMMYYGKLTKYVDKLPIVDKSGFISYKVSKQGNVISTMSAPLYTKILDIIKQNDKIKRDFLNLTKETLYQKYHKNSLLSKAIEDYIYMFGPRVMNELKLETMTLLEDPLFLYQMLQNSIKNDQDKNKNVNKIIINPTTLVEDLKLNIFKRIKLNKLINKTKYFIKNRETLRLRRTYLYSVIRRIFLQIGNNFKQSGIINEVTDIFYLKKEEILLIINGDINKLRNIIELVQKRKQEKLDNDQKTTYERIVFFDDKELKIINKVDKTGTLHGIPSGGGVVDGVVKLITSPENASLHQEIMLAERTDPGWIMLFPLCSGLICERGSILSHSAVVAREMGIPAVVGIKDATKIIKDGDKVTLDGIKGEVTIHE